ncbi:MAG TPA: hypothetical protein VLI90_08550 [Tepidisphaeraceae bacterium]|nr:hypothetical protein [Tepidisphaeraceae bacterium]
MIVAGADVGQAKLLHHDERGEIDEGDVRFVRVTAAHLPSAVETVRRDARQFLRAIRDGRNDLRDVRLRRRRANLRVDASDRLLST